MKLHIGTMGQGIPGFKKVDIVQHGDVDYVRDAKDLSCFKDEEIEEIYASHILEHFHKPDTLNVLKEWFRVLQKGGILYVAVPDFDVIVDLYLNSGRMFDTWTDHLIHGDQNHPQAFHYACFNYATLSGLFDKAGFSRISRIAEMPYGVSDASQIVDSRFKKRISVCVRGIK